MSLRTIMIFPKFNNIEIIDNIRSQYDPLTKLVRPHITIVFPFESQMTNKELTKILNMRLMSVKPFKLILGGISKHENTFGKYLFLDVLQGKEEICSIHQILYNTDFKEFNLGLHYIPHITIGKLSSVQLLNEAYNNIAYINDTFSTTINKISVEMIGDNEESIIVIEKVL